MDHIDTDFMLYMLSKKVDDSSPFWVVANLQYVGFETAVSHFNL